MAERGSYQELWMDDIFNEAYVGRVNSDEEAIDLHGGYCEAGLWPLWADAVIRTYSEATGILVDEKPLFEEDFIDD